jgi:energy-coupling factor transport system permease protein
VRVLSARGLASNISSGRGGRGILNLAPESRLFVTLCASVFSLIFGDIYSLGVLVLASALYLSLEARFRTILIVYLFFALMCSIALICVYLLGFVFQGMRTQSLLLAVTPFMRLLISVNAIIPLALNAKLSDMTRTLNRLRLPGLLKLPMLITIRFIPTFINDLFQLATAIRIRFRGKGGFFFWLRRPLLWWRVFFMPLVVRLIRSADELALAAELKGLSADTDLGSEKLILGRADRLVFYLSFFFIAAAILAWSLYA